MLTTTQSYVIYFGNGLTTSFPFSFLVPLATNMTVSITNNNVDPPITYVLSSSQYTVSGIGVATGGVVTYPVAGGPLPINWSMTIQRIVPYQQSTNLTNQGALYPQAIESALDNLTMQTQQLAAAITLGVLSTTVSPQLILTDTVTGESYQLAIVNGELQAQLVGAVGSESVG